MLCSRKLLFLQWKLSQPVNKNENTRKKTQQNAALLKEFLTLRNESRLIEEIAPKELTIHRKTELMFPCMFVIFLVELTSPRNSETRRNHLHRTLFTSSVFLLLTLDEFSDAFQGKNFRLETVCLFQGQLSNSLSGKAVSLTACLLVGF